MENVVSADDRRLIARGRSQIARTERLGAEVEALTPELRQRRADGWELVWVRRPETRPDLRVIAGGEGEEDNG